jgi:hypothetical protein
MLTSSLDAPSLLHLGHPFALEHLNGVATHIRQFRTYLGSLAASSENSQIARDVLADLVDTSGVDIVALEPFLVGCAQDCKMLDSELFYSILLASLLCFSRRAR